jgi:TP901 family phage tail tape measure protein
MSSDSLQIIIEAIDKASGVLKKITAGMNDVTTTAGKLNSIGKGMRSVGSALTVGVSLPLIAAGAAAVRASNDFNQATTAIQTLGVDGKSAGAAMMTLSKELNYSSSATQLATASYDVFSSMTDTLKGSLTSTAAAVEVLRTSSIAAAGGFTETSVVTNGLLSILGSYGLAASQSGRITDVMSQAVAAGRMTMQEFSDGAGKASGTLAAAGVSINEYSGLMIQATLQGVKASEATTGIVQATQAVIKPSAQAAQTAARLGLSWNGATLRAKGFVGILDDLKKVGATQEDMFKLFGSVEAVKAILPSAGSNLKAFSDQVKASQNSIGSSSKAANIALTSDNAKATASVNKLNNSLIRLGATLKIALMPLLEFGSLMIDTFNNLPASAQQAIVVIGVIAALIGPVVWIVGGLASAFGVVSSAAGVAGGAIAGLGLPSFGVAAALAANGLRAIATSALGLGVILGAAAFGFVNLFSAMSGAGGISPDVFMATITDSLAQLPVRLGMIIPVTQSIFSSLRASVMTTFYNLRSELSIWASGVMSTLSSTWQGISAGVSGAWSGIVSTVSGATQGFVSAIQGGMDSAASAVSSTMQSIVSSVQGIAGACYEAGASIVRSIADGIMSGIEAVRSAGAAVASAVSNFLPHSPPKEGALRDIMSVGGRITRFIAEGMQPNVVGNAMNAALSPPIDPSMMAIGSGGLTGGSQGYSNTSNAITVNISIDGTGKDGGAIASTLEARLSELLPRLLKESDRQKSRVAYS